MVLIFGFLTCRLDRKKQRKIKDWDKHHRKYVTMFELSVERAKATAGSQLRDHCPLAFNNYLTWFLANTRVEILKSAYDDEILEEPTVFDEVAQTEYNKYVREGTRVPHAPVMNFVVKCPLFAFPLSQLHNFTCLTCPLFAFAFPFP